jgi:hypothetical protein
MHDRRRIAEQCRAPDLGTAAGIRLVIDEARLLMSRLPLLAGDAEKCLARGDVKNAACSAGTVLAAVEMFWEKVGPAR